MTDDIARIKLIDMPLKELREREPNEDKISVDILVARSGRTKGHITLNEIKKLAKRRRTSVGELIRHLLIRERRAQLFGDFKDGEPLVRDPQLGFGNAQTIILEDEQEHRRATVETAIDAFHEDDQELDSEARH